MKLLWVSCYCSKKTFDDLFQSLENKPEVSIQHYLALLLSGVSDNGVKNITICERQISSREKKKFWKAYKENTEDGDTFYYLPIIAIPVLGQVIRSLAVIFKLLGFIIRGNKPSIIICDVMRFWVSSPALLIGKIFHIKTIGYAADIPQMYLHQYNGSKPWLYTALKKFYSSITTHYNAYIELSSYMDDSINPKQRPSIVIEGLVDNIMSDGPVIERHHDDAKSKTAVLYTGGLYEKYGVKMLIDAVAGRKDSAIELWLLGKGELEHYIEELNNPNIRYYGYCPHDKVVALQQKADFLINPRFSNEDYTKYSFPSKIMEYLVSGTPVIATRLRGIPSKYFDYLIPIEDETVEGLVAVFDKILKMDPERYFQLGENGKSFVLQNKNKNTQAKRLIEWLETVI